MNPMKSIRWLLPVAGSLAVLTGCGSAMGAANTSPHTMKAASSPGATAPGLSNDTLVGAASSPAMGSGSGLLIIDRTATKKTWKIPLAPGVNALTAAIGKNRVYVPSLQGTTFVVSLRSHKVVSTFKSPVGDRIATLSRAPHLLLLTGPHNVTAYSFPDLKQIWQINDGGNALTIVGNRAYLSGNGSGQTQTIDLTNGHITGTLPVGHIEDSVYDPRYHTLWLANWTTGDMTVVNALAGQIVRVLHNKEGGGFHMSHMMGSSGGFMQLAVGPGGQHVYAASFSGNIMQYNAASNTFQKNIPVQVPMAKLSGIAIDPSGQYAYTTVESQKETVAVSLKTGRVVSISPGLASNRWFVINR